MLFSNKLFFNYNNYYYNKLLLLIINLMIK